MDILEKKLKITGLGENIPDTFTKEIEKLKKKLPELQINYGMAPNFLAPYYVDSPLVKYSSGTINRTEYGMNGLALIRDVASGKIR